MLQWKCITPIEKQILSWKDPEMRAIKLRGLKKAGLISDSVYHNICLELNLPEYYGNIDISGTGDDYIEEYYRKHQSGNV